MILTRQPRQTTRQRRYRLHKLLKNRTSALIPGQIDRIDKNLEESVTSEDTIIEIENTTSVPAETTNVLKELLINQEKEEAEEDILGASKTAEQDEMVTALNQQEQFSPRPSSSEETTDTGEQLYQDAAGTASAETLRSLKRKSSHRFGLTTLVAKCWLFSILIPLSSTFIRKNAYTRINKCTVGTDADVSSSTDYIGCWHMIPITSAAAYSATGLNFPAAASAVAMACRLNFE